jgi:hypothetical protein
MATWTAAKACIPGPENRLGPIRDMEFREDRGGMVTDRLTG